MSHEVAQRTITVIGQWWQTARATPEDELLPYEAEIRSSSIIIESHLANTLFILPSLARLDVCIVCRLYVNLTSSLYELAGSKRRDEK